MRHTIQNANASLYFNGAATKVAVTTPASVNDLVALSVSCWVKYARDATANGRIFFKGGTGTGFFNISVNQGLLSLSATWSGTNQDHSYRLQKNSIWKHITVTYSGIIGSPILLYVNGQLTNTTTVTPSTGTRATDTTALAIGNRTEDAARSFNGLITNLNWYNRVLTAAEALQLYQGSTPTSGLIGSYPLSEGAGTVAYDTSGNGNDGTITSGSWSRETPTKTRKGVNGNMVYNGDFEIAPVVNVPQTTWFKYIDGTVGGTSSITPFGWYAFDRAGSVAVMFDSTTKKSGNYSLKLSTTATASFCSVGQGSFDPNTGYIKVSPSTSYTYSFWMKTTAVSGSATAGARIIFSSRNGAGTALASSASTFVATTTDWTQYTGTFTTHASAVYLSVSAVVSGDTGAGTLIMDAWFDDITLYPTTPITRSAATGRSLAGTRSAA